MAFHHNYHPSCGCSVCCQQEAVDEQVEELAQGLRDNPSILSEAMGEIDDGTMAQMAKSLADGDDIDFAGEFRIVIAKYVADMIERRADECGFSQIEAVMTLREVYEVPSRAPAMRAAA